MLSLRTRGKNKIYYIRGSVTLDDRKIVVKEFSTGTSDRDAASHLMAAHEKRLREQLMFGPATRMVDATIADAFAMYLAKEDTPHPSDILRVGKLNEEIGGRPMQDYKTAWRDFRKKCIPDHAPAGKDRYRSVLQAALNVYREDNDLDPIKIKTIPFENKRVRWLSLEERDLLISCYAPHVQPIITFLAFHGPRVQDALQIQWGAQGVDMEREAITIVHQKTTTSQAVPMHPRVREVLLPLWESAGSPKRGHVFLNSRGAPYQDTRKAKMPGGNPLRSAHGTALKRSGIEDFTMHDWRHHWASHCVMAGIDLITIAKMGGWSSIRMVERYASVGVEHMRESIDRLA